MHGGSFDISLTCGEKEIVAPSNVELEKGCTMVVKGQIVSAVGAKHFWVLSSLLEQTSEYALVATQYLSHTCTPIHKL